MKSKINTSAHLKNAAFVSIGMLSFLFLLSIYFYKERVIFMDASYILFQIMNDGHHAIQENRYGSFITHIVPMLLYKLNFSAKAIIISYTLSFNLFYLCSITWLVVRLKQYGLAILMSLYYILFVSETFYWSNNEVHQGIAWMFLTLGLLQYAATKRTHTIILLFILLIGGFLAISSHMLVTMSFTFLFVYLLLDKNLNHYQAKQQLFLSGSLLLIIFIKYQISLHQNYDGEKLKLIDKLSFNDLAYYIQQDFGIAFLKSCIQEYWPVVPILLLGLYSLIKQKKYLLSLCTLMACTCFYMFMCITFSNTGQYEKFHIESEWMVLGLILATPFVFNFLPSIRPKWAAHIVCIIAIIRFAFILNASNKFETRLQTTEKILAAMQKKGINKLALVDSKALQQIYLLDWSLAEESLLLSCLNKDTTLRTFFILRSGAIPDSILFSKRIFIGCFHNYTPVEINKKYFLLDTLTAYKIYSLEQLMR